MTLLNKYYWINCFSCICGFNRFNLFERLTLKTFAFLNSNNEQLREQSWHMNFGNLYFTLRSLPRRQISVIKRVIWTMKSNFKSSQTIPNDLRKSICHRPMNSSQTYAAYLANRKHLISFNHKKCKISKTHHI